MSTKRVPSRTETTGTNGQSELEKFPLRRIFFVIIAVLLLLSLFSVSIERDPTSSVNWKVSTTISVSTITLTLLLVAWIPIIIPWLVSLSPRLQSSLEWLRAGGVEEVEAGGIRMKLASLASGVAEAAQAYENKIISEIDTQNRSIQTAEEVSQLYTNMVDKLETSDRLPRAEALRRIDQVAEIYNEVRDKMSSGPERTQLLTQISATMWSLMPSVEYFDTEDRINSYDGGKRLSAYKFIEWQPRKEYLDILTSRALGILETPFGQYSALLALQRVMTNNTLEVREKESIESLVKWASNLPYIGSDRRYLMRNILSILGNN